MANKKEVWKAITIDGKKPTVPYMISNHGRFGVKLNGKIQVRTFKPTAGNYRYNTRQNGKSRAIFLYKEVAKAFLKKPSARHNFIIHKDHDYLNDHVSNLQWVTYNEHRVHTSMSPKSILARKRKAIVKSSHSKVLDEKKVKALKTMIWDPKRKLTFKQIAEKFNVSEMQIYRIKTGEFWYHVRVEGEPLHPKYKQNLSNISYHEKKAAKAKKASDSAPRALKKNEKPILSVLRKKKDREKNLKRSRLNKLRDLVRGKIIEKALSKKRAGKNRKKNYSILKISL